MEVVCAGGASGAGGGGVDGVRARAAALQLIAPTHTTPSTLRRNDAHRSPIAPWLDGVLTSTRTCGGGQQTGGQRRAGVGMQCRRAAGGGARPRRRCHTSPPARTKQQVRRLPRPTVFMVRLNVWMCSLLSSLV